MAERVQLASEQAAGAILWKHGKKLVGGEGSDILPDVRVIRTRTLTGIAVEKGWLSFRLEPMVKRVQIGDGTWREVQTFRCWSAQHQDRLLLVCGSCGDLCFGDAADLVAAAEDGCRACGMNLGNVGCITPHTFGSCLYCPDASPLFDPVTALTFARAADSPSPQTGPPQPSNGLVAPAVLA